MAFDADKFTTAAKQAGYSDEDIQSEIQRQTKNINAATGQEFGKAGEAAVQSQAQEWRNQGTPMPGTKQPEDIRSLGSQLIDWSNTPAGTAVLGGLGLAGVAAGMGINARRKSQAEAAPKDEPTFNEPPPPTGPKFTPPQGDVTDVASRPVGEERLQIGGPRALPAPEAAVPSAAAPAPEVPSAPVAPPATAEAAPVAPKPVDPLVQAKLDAIAADQRRKDEAHAAEQRRKDEAHANRLANDAKRAEASTQKKQGQVKSSIPPKDQAILADNAEAKARAELVASGQPKPKTASPIGGTSIPVEGAATPPAGEPPVKAVAPAKTSKSELKPGYEFRPGFGTSDTYLVDTIGPEKYKIARMEMNEGKPFGQYDVNLVKNVMDKYRVGEKVTAEAAKAAGAGAMSSPGGVPSKSIQRGVKVAGVLGMGLPAWLAARASELPGYEEAMNRANAAVPGLGESANAMPFSRGEEFGKLGKSYVTAGNANYIREIRSQLETEKNPARKAILQEELQKAGGSGSGRGIAPPSEYQR